MKLVIFDLDGVLVDIKLVHYDALNQAIANVAGQEYIISYEEHLAVYDGLKSKQKLDLLTKNKNLSIELHKDIWETKQKLTHEKLLDLQFNFKIVQLFEKLKSEGYKLACCSNSIKQTVDIVTERLGIKTYFDVLLSNEDVTNSKPHPEIFWKAMSLLNVLPEQTIIVEDSPHGLLAANRAACETVRVKNAQEIEKENFIDILKQKNKPNIMTPKWKAKNLNVLIPMAGAGSRFEQAGYTFPKPLIEVSGKPMIQVVVENLNMEANFIYVVQKSHRKQYNLDTLLNLITPNCTIVETEGITEGAACTALLAKRFINNNNPLFFANSDQWVEWDSNEFMYKMQETNVDGGIVTFEATHPKWSFVKVDENGYVTEVAEKNPISNTATVGFYFWKNGSDFVKYAEQMIANNVRVNGEFYVCPVFNQAIGDNKKVITFNVNSMWWLGTPEDLEHYIKSYKPIIS